MVAADNFFCSNLHFNYILLRIFINFFFSSSRSSCLLNHPETDLIVHENMSKRLPGETFNQDKQCELVFGWGAKICSYMVGILIFFKGVFSRSLKTRIN